MIALTNCTECPRRCGANRETGEGFCRASGINVSLMTSHMHEEPCISVEKGSGAIFFSGCALRCVYCQNQDISRTGSGERLTENEFIRRAKELADVSDNLNFITPSHLYPYIISALSRLKKLTRVPFIFNTSGYDSVEQIEKLKGIADVYLPDFKYSSCELSKNLSAASDYPEKATAAIKAMIAQVGVPKFSGKKIVSGVIVRHLVLPGYKENSLSALQIIKSEFGGSLLSLMSQYCPDFYSGDDSSLKRRVTTYEYNAVLERAVLLGLDGFMQSRESAKASYTPNFRELAENNRQNNSDI